MTDPKNRPAPDTDEEEDHPEGTFENLDYDEYGGMSYEDFGDSD